MKYEVELNGHFEVNINFWSGRCEVSYEGMELKEERKNTFMLGSEEIIIRGSLFSGVCLCRGEQKVVLIKLKWYDYIAEILPFIVSLIGGALGAVFGAIGFFLCYKTMPYVKNYALRLLICVGIAVAVFVIILLIAMLFPSLFGIVAKND